LLIRGDALVRLLFALPGFHRFDRGAEIALLAIANQLAQMGRQVTVMGSGEQRPGTSYNYLPVRSIRRERFEGFLHLPAFRDETQWEDASFAICALRRYNPAHFDAVVTCSFPWTHWMLRKPTRASPAQIFVTQNGDWPAVANKSEYSTFSCDGLICTNPDYYERNKETWNAKLIPNGIDLTRFSPGIAAKRLFGLPEGKPIVLMVSALIDSKRVLDGIRAVAKLDDAILVVAGDGPLRDQAESLAKELLRDRYFRLNLSSSEMPNLYRVSDAFLHLSLLESFGNVFLEAWATGLPIVGHDSDRLRWILGDNANYLCDTEHEIALVETLKSALSNKSSQTSRHPGVERFSWDNIAKEYDDFVLDVISQKALTRRGS
jgi:glycosyltransferase involved in cell wall biosynthesis